MTKWPHDAPLSLARTLHRSVAIATIGIVILCSEAFASASARPAGTSIAYDFLLENVCLDKNGRVLVGVSPIDGNPKCVAQRDLRPGESLPYHEREWPAQDFPLIRGSDSFPVKTSTLGIIAVHVFDYKPRNWRGAFDLYDTATRLGGGSVAAVSNEFMSYVATQLGPQKLQLFVGKTCKMGQAVSSGNLFDSWQLAPLAQLATMRLPSTMPTDGSAIAEGFASAAIQIVSANDDARCPMRLAKGSVHWSVRPITYRAIYKSGPAVGTHVRLWSLVATHSGHDAANRDRAIAFERAYFTRELGWTRWEAWRSIDKNLLAIHATRSIDPLMARDRIIRRGNCELPQSNAGNAPYGMPAAPVGTNGKPRPDLVMVGCIEVTRIVPPLHPDGDPAPTGAGSWYATITRSNLLGARLFGQ